MAIKPNYQKQKSRLQKILKQNLPLNQKLHLSLGQEPYHQHLVHQHLIASLYRHRPSSVANRSSPLDPQHQNVQEYLHHPIAQRVHVHTSDPPEVDEAAAGHNVHKHRHQHQQLHRR
jgi:hypothetical protein